MTRWRGLDQTAAKLWVAGKQRRVNWPRPLQRLDPVLFGVVAAAGLGLAGLGWTLAAVERTRGFFDPPVAAPVADPRILSDFRRAAAPFADAVMLGDDAFLGRTDGTILRYDTETELFSQEALPQDNRLTGALSLLSQGCGDQPGAALPPCALNGTLFAVTDRGGLAARKAGQWQVVLADAGWIGPDGTAVAQADLVAWAVSADGRWMLAAAGAKGLGLFDQHAGGWYPLPARGSAEMAPTRIHFAAGAFWLGGPAGLERVTPSTPPLREAVAGGEGDIYDLDLTADGGLLALRRGGCAQGDGCLSILSVSPRGVLSVLAGETALSPGLSQARVDHAAMQAGRLVVLGEAGVHVYDPVRRNWQALETRPVDAYHASADGTVIHFAAASRFATISGGNLRDDRKLSVPLRQVLPIAGGQVLGLNRDGAVLDLAPAVPVTLAFADPGLPVGVRFVAGAQVGETVVMLGPQGALLHDTKARRYAFQDPASLPPALVAALAGGLADARSVRVLAAHGRIWAIDMAKGQVYLGVFAGDWPDRQVLFSAHLTMQTPLRSAQAQGDSLDVVTQDGAAFRVLAGTPNAAEPLTGRPLPQSLAPQAMAGTQDNLFFAEANAIWRYDLAERGWFGPFEGPESQISDLALGQQHLYALTPSGALYQRDGPDWEPVSGVGPGAPIARDEVTDAQVAQGQLYLAGNGKVIRYAPDLRRFTAAWSGGRGDVRMVSVQGGVPIWASGGQLLFGETVVSTKTETVLGAWAGPNGPLYLARQNGRLHAVELGNGRSCLFLGGEAPGGALIDARDLPDGRVFVLTTTAAAIYDPAQRRWSGLTDDAGGADSRLEVLDGHLLRLDGGRLRSILLADLPLQTGCAANPLAIRWQTDLAARALAVDTVAGAVHVLLPNGAVQRWQGGSVRPVLAAPNTAPDPAVLRRVYPQISEVVFAGETDLWRYDTGARSWGRLPFANAPPQIAEVDVDVSAGAAGVFATVWDGDGAGWRGERVAEGLAFSRLALPPLPIISVPPETVIDMQVSGGLFAVLGTQHLEVFRKDSMTFLGRVALPRAQQAWSLARAEGAAPLLLVDGDPAAPLAVYGINADRVRGGIALDAASWRYVPGTDFDWALTRDGNLWRIDADLALWRCTAADQTRCSLITAAPLAMTADTIRAVEPAGEPAGGADSYLLQPDRLLHLGADARLLGQIAGPLITDAARLFTTGAEVLLWEGPSRPLWRLANGKAEQVLPQVQALQPYRAGLALTTPEGLRLRENKVFAPTGDALLALSLARDGKVYALTPEGGIWAHEAARSIDPVLRLPLDTVALHPGELTIEGAVRRGWWALARSGALRFDWVSQCTAPLPQPLLAPNGLPVGGSGGSANEARAIAALPKPVPQPCQATVHSPLRLPAAVHLLQVDGLPSAPTLITTAGEITLDDGLAEVSRAPLRQMLPDMPQALARLSDMRQRVAVLGGRSWLAPPVIDNSPSGQLLIRGPVPSVSLEGSTLLQPWAAFDLGWLGWDKAARQVRFGTGATALRLPLEQALVDGLFLPAHPGRAAYLGNKRFAWLNGHGLWHVQDGTSITPVLAQPFAPANGLAHGRFLLPGVGVDAVTGAISADMDRFEAASGPLTFAERLRGGGVTATLDVGAQPVPAFGPRGFSFDSRAGIGASSGQAVLLTPLGLVPVNSLQGADRVPVGTDHLGQQGAQLFAAQGAAWQARAPDGTWQPAQPPDSTRLLAQESGRRWQRVAGRAEVVPINAAEGWRVAGHGLAFEADRLVAMAADTAGVVLVTGSGTHTASGLLAAATLAPPQAPDPGGAAVLDALAVAAGQSVIWANTAAGRLEWDRSAKRWVPPKTGRQPWADRRAAELGPIALSFRHGLAEAVMNVTGLDGTPHAAAFDWARDEVLPFDRVRALHVEAGKLLLGTDFGLRRLTETAGLATSDAVFATGPGTADPVPVLGRPDALPRQLLAQTARGGCLELPDAISAPQACADAGGLARRRVVQNDFWRWTKGDGRVDGQYLLSDGATRGISLPLRGGLPHDRLRDRARCAGIEAELWADAPIATRLQGGHPVRLDPVEGVTGFQCQTADAFLGQGQGLPKGLHAIGTGALLATPAGWNAEGMAQAQSLTERARGFLPMDAARLRIGLAQGVPVAHYRGQDDVWHLLPWGAGRLPVDTVQGLAAAGGGVQAFTAAGVAGMVGRSALAIDPAGLMLATPDDRAGFADCTLDRIEMWDGTVQAAPRQADRPVALRCGDGRVFAGNPAASVDRAAFARLADDPFEDRVLVEVPEFWTWARTGAVPGQRGALEIVFKGEPIGLDGGRLSLDDYMHIAAPFGDKVELVSLDGWWRHPAGEIGVQAATRGAGQQPGAVTGLTSDRDADGAGLLCLEGATNQVMPAAGPLRRAEACRDWTGGDTIWQWHQGKSGPQASGTAANGVAMRRVLEAGRFADLIATGAPMGMASGEIIVPTRIGATVIGARGAQGLYARDKPVALMRSASGAPQIVDADGVLPVGPALLAGASAGPLQCPAVQAVAARLPEGMPVLRIEMRDPNKATLTLQGQKGRVQIVVPCTEVEKALTWVEVMDVTDRPRFLANAAGWPDRAGQLAVAVTAQGFDLGAGGALGVSVSGLTEGRPIALFAGRNRRSVFLLTEQDFYRVNTDHAIRLVAQEAVPIAPLAGPFAPAVQKDAAQPGSGPDAQQVPQQAPHPAADPAFSPQLAPALGKADNSPLKPLTKADARAVQAALAALGLYTGGIDGAVGPITRAALRQWQREQGLEPTGALTQNQFDALLAEGGQ